MMAPERVRENPRNVDAKIRAMRKDKSIHLHWREIRRRPCRKCKDQSTQCNLNEEFQESKSSRKGNETTTEKNQENSEIKNCQLEETARQVAESPFAPSIRGKILHKPTVESNEDENMLVESAYKKILERLPQSKINNCQLEEPARKVAKNIFAPSINERIRQKPTVKLNEDENMLVESAYEKILERLPQSKINNCQLEEPAKKVTKNILAPSINERIWQRPTVKLNEDENMLVESAYKKILKRSPQSEISNCLLGEPTRKVAKNIFAPSISESIRQKQPVELSEEEKMLVESACKKILERLPLYEINNCQLEEPERKVSKNIFAPSINGRIWQKPTVKLNEDEKMLGKGAYEKILERQRQSEINNCEVEEPARIVARNFFTPSINERIWLKPTVKLNEDEKMLRKGAHEKKSERPPQASQTSQYHNIGVPRVSQQYRLYKHK